MIVIGFVWCVCCWAFFSLFLFLLLLLLFLFVCLLLGFWGVIVLASTVAGGGGVRSTYILVVRVLHIPRVNNCSYNMFTLCYYLILNFRYQPKESMCIYSS